MALPVVRIHDSLRGVVRPLEPRDPGRVGIYVCGPTVYGRIHVGNARPFVTFALMKRFLEHEGYAVTLVENITDINDKIYVAARERGVPSQRLADEMAAAYRADTDRLQLGRPDHEPLASETIGEIVDLIAALVAGGHAYESSGDVYFSVRSYEPYGQLSNRRLSDLLPADQGEPADDVGQKRDPLDFALWKTQKDDEDTAWDSPWGRGRPGWHIECSAMAEKILGLDFDVHGGGLDLVFPHHENEIAQTDAGRARPLARIWMHNGMIRFGEQKMAKSVGNVKPLSDALDEHGRDALIMYFLGAHYRHPLAFSAEALDQAWRALERIVNFGRLVERSGRDSTEGDLDPLAAGLRSRFLEALRDDFKTPQALAALFDLVAEGNRRLEAGERFEGVAPALREMLAVLGLDNVLEDDQPADAEAHRMALEREQARLDRDFSRADELRDRLADRGYQVRDTSDGPVLVPTRPPA